jgi:hypothetical protein
MFYKAPKFNPRPEEGPPAGRFSSFPAINMLGLVSLFIFPELSSFGYIAASLRGSRDSFSNPVFYVRFASGIMLKFNAGTFPGLLSCSRII